MPSLQCMNTGEAVPAGSVECDKAKVSKVSINESRARIDTDTDTDTDRLREYEGGGME